MRLEGWGRPPLGRPHASRRIAAQPCLLNWPRPSPAAMLLSMRPIEMKHLAARECGLALLHEGPAALDEVLAGEALLHHLRAARKVALGFVLHHLADDVLDRLHRER